MATLTTTINSIRATVDREGTDVQVTDTILGQWINEEYLQLRRRLADLVPDLYTAISGDIAIASGNTLSLASISSTLGKLLHVQRKEGVDYFALQLAPRTDPESPSWGRLSYRQRGAANVDVFPTTDAPGTYRVRYVTKPATLVSGSDALDVPDGAERIVEERVAARCRAKWEEDPSYHLGAAANAWEEVRSALIAQYLATPTAVIDVTGEF